MIEAIRDLFRDFARQPLRSLLSLFGILLGSASIVFLASALTAAGVAFGRLSQAATGSDITRIMKRPPAALVSEARTTRQLGAADAVALTRHEGLADDQVTGGQRLMTQEASVGAKRKAVGMQSGGARYGNLAKLELQHGRWMTPDEDGQRVCVIGYDIWKDLFDGQWPLPREALVFNNATRLEVVGVLKARPPMGMEGDGTWAFDRRIYVSNPTFTRAIDPTPEYREIVVRHDLVDGKDPDLLAIAGRLTRYLQTLHMGVRNFQFDVLNQGFQMFNLIIFAVGAIMFSCGLVAMVVGGVNVMNAQLVSLSEKTKEYGIRRALGASARDLRRRVIVESLVFTGVGGLLGLALGLGGAWAVAKIVTAFLTPWAFYFVPWSVAAALLSSVGVGLLAGLLPARRAAALVPSECLRAE